MPQSLTNFDNALKEIYAPGLRNSINNSNPVWAEATPWEDLDLVGEEAVWSVHSGRSNATGARAELGTLPTADRQRFIKPRKGLKSIYHTIKVSGQAEALTRNPESAFGKALDVEIKGAEKDLKNSMSRQVFGTVVPQTGDTPDTWKTGFLAQINGAPAANVITLDSFGSALDDSIMRHFFVGMILDAVNPADGVVRSGSSINLTITAIDKANKTITVTEDGDAADNDYLAVSGSYGEEIDGLRALLSEQSPPGSTDDYDYAGVDVSANLSWLAQQVGSTTTPISEVLLDEAIEKVETDGDGSTPEFLVCEHAQRRKLASLLQSQKRYEGRDMTLTSGWKGLALARGVLVADRYCPTNHIFGIYKPELAKFVGLDFKWDEAGGSVLFKALDGSDAVQARFKGYIQLAAAQRSSHFLLKVATPTF